MKNNFNSQKIHLTFISIISLNYLIPLILFGDVTLFYHDTLDSEIVFNTIIANSFKDNFESMKLFLNEEIRIEYLRRAYQPFNFFYYIFSPKIAYLTVDILVKLTAYFSFFTLAKKLNPNVFTCALVAAIFSSLNERTVEGFGFAFMPYIIYLISFKKEINFKHIFFIVLFGINTDIVKCLTCIPILVIITYILNSKKEKIFLKHSLQVISIFVFSIIISNFNLIYGQLKFGEIQRTVFFHEYFPFFKNLIMYFFELFHVPTWDWTFFRWLPVIVLNISIFMLTFMKKEKKSIQLIFLIILINLVPFIFRTEIVSYFRNSIDGIFKTFQFQYITSIIFLIFSVTLIRILNYYKVTIIFKILIVILIFFQINSSVVPSYKKFFTKNENYRNIYTFNGYYMFNDYKKIKSIVLNEKTMTVGYDPMIAVMNKIYAIDGYHNIYPLDYKFKFRKIIEKELENNNDLKKYYDNWGNRLYAFVSDEKNINLNFLEAKYLGAKYVISKFKIENLNLKLIDDEFENRIYLYKLI